MFENIEKRGDDFVKLIDKFEAKVDDALNYATDIKLKPDAIHPNGLNLEYKSWKKDTYGKLMNGDQFKNQLKNYIKDGDFEYVVDAKKLLNDGVPNPNKFVREQFQEVFKKDAKELFDQNSELFKRLNISNETLLKNLADNNKLIDHPLFDLIIKVE